MKKQLFISIMAVAIVGASASLAVANNQFKKEVKGIGSQVSKDVKKTSGHIKSTVKKDIKSIPPAARKAKVAELTKLRNEKIRRIDAEISASKSKLATIRTSAIRETEKAEIIDSLNRKLNYLHAKRADILKTYNNKIESYK